MAAQTSTMRQHGGRAGLRSAIFSEWTKLRSVRSTLWSVVVMGAISVGLMSVIAWTVIHSWDDLSPERRSALTHQPLDVILVQPVYMAQIVVAVLGVMVVSAEYTTGAIKSTLQAQPRRLTVLAAKSIVLAIVTFIVGEVLSFVAYMVGKSIVAHRISIHLHDPGVLRAVFGAGLYFTVLSLFSLAVGAVIRHTAGAITAVLGLILVVSGLTGLLPGTWGSRINAWMPTNAGQLILVPDLGPDPILTQWEGMAVFGGWTALVLLVAAVLLVRRDACGPPQYPACGGGPSMASPPHSCATSSTTQQASRAGEQLPPG